MAPEARLYTEAEVEKIVGRRLAEREQRDLVDNLRGELNELSTAVHAANDLKKTLGKQVEDQTQAINQLSVSVREHTANGTIHPVNGETRIHHLEQMDLAFGIDGLSDEERSAFPSAYRALIAAQRTAVVQERTQQAEKKASVDFWQKIAGVGAAAAVIVAVLSAAGVFDWFKHVVLHQP